MPQIFADPDKFTQVVTNVVDNAIRHGEGTVTVTVEPITQPFEGVLLRVDDEGEGIAEEIRVRVFTKFWKHGVRGGTGLGMYIVNGLVRVHGGEVRSPTPRAAAPGSTSGGPPPTAAEPANSR